MYKSSEAENRHDANVVVTCGTGFYHYDNLP